MKSFPMFIKLAHRRVVIAGGGEQAAQKARLMLKTEADLTLLALELDEELAAIVADGRAQHEAGRITTESFVGSALVFIATGCPAVDASLHAIAKAAGATVNVVDQPDLCDVTTPSIVDRDPVVVAIGSEGTAPVLARQIKTRIEEMLDPRIGGFAALAGRLRGAVAARVAKEDRRAFWRWTFSESPMRTYKLGAERKAAKLIKSAIDLGFAPDKASVGSISLVGAGPGARDLLTLRAVERLQEADVIFYDRLVDPEILELARRDAERVYVGKVVGASTWPQDRINAVVLAAARQGKRVVRLKSGDPSIFGRTGEELSSAKTLGIPVEIVPGVTAASAAAARLGRSLTERGVTDHVVLATGTCQPGDQDPDWGSMARQGTTLVLYMAIHKITAVEKNLLESGLSPSTEVEIVEQATLGGERIHRTELSSLAATTIKNNIRGPAVLFVRRPKTENREEAVFPEMMAANQQQ